MEGTNHFAYANCNPLKYVDPTGLAFRIDDLVVSIICAVVATIIGIIAAAVGGSSVTITADVSVPIGDSGGGNTGNESNNNVSPGGGKIEDTKKSDSTKKNEDNNPYTTMNVEKKIQEIPNNIRFYPIVDWIVVEK